jgi:predicted enzyme related to lactoylglutathione lyase
MPERSSPPHGVPTWIDLASPDLDASVAFYGGLFGWQHAAAGPAEETGGYGVFSLRGKQVAGVMPLQSESQPRVWSTYIAVDDADAAVAQATEAGGQVAMAVIDVMGQGRMAYLLDPAGAMIGVWQAGGNGGAQLVDEPGTLGWNELNTRDLASAEAFYASVFGWDAEPVESSGGNYVMFNVGGRPVAGMIRMTERWPADMPAHWRVYFFVTDTDATVARALELGGSVTVPAFDLEDVGRIAMLADSNGTPFAVMTPVDADE